MSADKRAVSTDALATLGTIITDGGRDAIHLAVEPVVAGEKIWPGQDIGLKDGRAYNQASIHGIKYLGIADPFLKEAIMPEQKFWLIVYPRQITSLRHVWEHPDFVATEEKIDSGEVVFKAAVTIQTSGKTPQQISEEWLRAYADEIDESYENLMSVADSHQGGGNYPDYIIQGGRFEGESTPDEFWEHYALVRGVKNPVRSSFFSCSC